MGRPRATSRGEMRSRLLSRLHPYRRFLLDLLDVLIAALFMTVLGLTASYFIQSKPSFTRPALLPTTAAGSMNCRPLCSIPVIAGAAGRIRTIHVHEGNLVRRGDVLLQLDTRELQEKINTLLRRIHFTELGLTTNADLRHASLSNLYRELERTRLELNRLTISSPHDGQIIALGRFHSGALLSAGDAVALLRIQK